jgi:signal transduction histidine kinase
MHKRQETPEHGVREDKIRQLGLALHDLCQPLTTLQCRLEMAQIVDTTAGYREAIETGLAECERLCAAVGSMREIVRAASRQTLDRAHLGKA